MLPAVGKTLAAVSIAEAVLGSGDSPNGKAGVRIPKGMLQLR